MGKRGKGAIEFVVLFHDGLGSPNPFPEEPSDRNTVTGGAEGLLHWFRKTLRESGNDYKRAPGYESPWADVFFRDQWDGTSYGDWMEYRLYCGPNMGARIEKA